MIENKTLGAVDYVMFSLILIISLSIGIYHAIKSRLNKSTSADYFVGGRNMPVFAISLSLLASFMSAIALLGTPSEIYQFGTMYWYIVIAFLFVVIISNYVFIPVFYNLDIISSYEYLGARFHKCVQIMSASSFIFQMTIYMGIVLYAPSLALSAVTGFNVWLAVFTVGPIAIAYTSIGGMKAVMWTDVFQIFIMFSGLFAVIIRGSVIHGGFGNIIALASKAKRIQADNFSLSPDERHTFWTSIVGGTMMWTAIYGVNQTMIQRALTSKSLKAAQLAYWFNAPGLASIVSLCCASGLVVVATYVDCDPQTIGRIYAPDQLVPLFVMDHLSFLPGLAGLFVAALFSGAMSTISSGLNSLAAVTLQDIILLRHPNLKESTISKITKGLTFGYGGLCLFFAYISSMLGPVLSAALSLFGMLAGPVLGVMTLGMLFPFVNWKGAVAGHIMAQLFTLYVGLGFYGYGVKPGKLPVSTDRCNETIANWTALTTPRGVAAVTTMATIVTNAQDSIPYIHKTSYLWYTLIAFSVAVIVGISVSLCTGCNKDKHTKARYISPVVRWLWARIPPESPFAIDLSSDTEDMDEKTEVEDTTKSATSISQTSAAPPFQTNGWSTKRFTNNASKSNSRSGGAVPYYHSKDSMKTECTNVSLSSIWYHYETPV